MAVEFLLGRLILQAAVSSSLLARVQSFGVYSLGGAVVAVYALKSELVVSAASLDDTFKVLLPFDGFF